ncbi:GntR family transcriptional regulator [Dysgonomonas termitidis]|uniref:GntR family transcriptional regulator n=1 Tax=Dysgonomonas termitidis TaxID=1516126 RepID=A0ABV9KUY9_9BACT
MSIKWSYKTIYDVLKNEIINNVYPFESYLPTESVLAEKYSVSRPTIAKVYNTLQDEGYVVKRPGMGTTVIYKTQKDIPLFGLLLPGAGESEIFSIINERFLNQSKKGLFNCLWEGTTTSNAELRRDLIEKCTMDYINQHVDGIFFAPLERIRDAEKFNKEICKKLEDAGIPIVLIDRDILDFPLRSRFDLVCLDNFHAGYIMAQHLIKAGCEKIYFFSRPDSANSVNMRFYGVSAAMQDSDLQFTKSNIVMGNPEDTELVKSLKIIPRKTGIICANDSTAAVLMSSIDGLGIKITSDVLVAGYDDMKYADHLKYPLTSFRQPCTNITDVAIDMMFLRLKNPSPKALTVNLEGTLLARESSRFI